MFEYIGIVDIGPDLKLHADILIAFGRIRVDSQETIQVDITFQLTFQFLDVDTLYSSVGHHARGYAGSQRIE